MLYQIYYDIVSFSVITLLHDHICDCKLLLIYYCSLLHYYCIIIMSLLCHHYAFTQLGKLYKMEIILLHITQYNYVSIFASLLYDIVSS